MQMSSTCAHDMAHREADRDRTADPLSAARGMMLGCAIGAGFWIGVVALAIA